LALNIDGPAHHGEPPRIGRHRPSPAVSTLTPPAVGPYTAERRRLEIEDVPAIGCDSAAIEPTHANQGRAGTAGTSIVDRRAALAASGRSATAASANQRGRRRGDIGPDQSEPAETKVYPFALMPDTVSRRYDTPR
jgi:hypothetical protein